MRRRAVLAGFLAGGGALSAAGRAHAADPALIAMVITSGPGMTEPVLAGFRQGLAQAGLVEGRDVALAIHYLDGDVGRLPALAEAVVAARPRVIVAASPVVAVAMRHATATIPIVVGTAVDPVGAGLASSLARPGGNVTGLSGQELDLMEKQFGLIPELLPHARRVLGLSSAARLPLSERMETTFASLATRLGVEARLVLVDPRPDVPALRAAIDEFRPDALFVIGTPVTVFLRREIAATAETARLPVIAPYRSLTEAGALASYGPDLAWNWKRVAWYVDRILKGASPAEMPFEQPTGFELVINQRAARALGITVPPILLTHADEVIE
jgi:putative ABC transport system substrate-binding protein